RHDDSLVSGRGLSHRLRRSDGQDPPLTFASVELPGGTGVPPVSASGCGRTGGTPGPLTPSIVAGPKQIRGKGRFHHRPGSRSLNCTFILVFSVGEGLPSTSA